jgi:hypothetical protein
MDKQKDTKQKFNIAELVKDKNSAQKQENGCSHYRRKAQFVVSHHLTQVHECLQRK